MTNNLAKLMEQDYQREERERDEWDAQWGGANNHYEDVDCANCGRHRVYLCLNGHLVCERCGWDNTDNFPAPQRP